MMQVVDDTRFLLDCSAARYKQLMVEPVTQQQGAVEGLDESEASQSRCMKLQPCSCAEVQRENDGDNRVWARNTRMAANVG